MCGIAGIISTSKMSRDDIESMTSVLSHRGPDSSGIWISVEGNVQLGHQRLAVLDLSDAGHQPMHSSCSRYCISYNGEIYNANDIRNELQVNGITFRGTSDTEVVLEACARYGIVHAVQKFVGMFAFAIWDNQKKDLYLVRDRLGIKPLYWGRFGDLFLFASELKSLRRHPGWTVAIDRSALSTYIRYGYISAPQTIYQGIYKLEPGMMLKLTPGGTPDIQPYWKMGDAILNGMHNRFTGEDEDIILTTEKILNEVITSRMISDVPLGAFLSGGIDSTTVVAMMQHNSTRPVRTFSIGFHEQGYNEAEHARKIADYLGTDHTEFYVTPEDAINVIPSLQSIYDEPFADSSQIPTYLVSSLTREHVTVALSGDGGDEVFAGYNRYIFAKNLVNRLDWLTPAGRKFIHYIIYNFPPKFWTRLHSYLPGLRNIPQLGNKLYKFADILDLEKSDIYGKLTSQWFRPDEILIDGNKYFHERIVEKDLPIIETLIERMQYEDFTGYLPDDILTKVDRASMAVSLEVRVPLLDHRLVEHAWSLPLSMKIRNGKNKWILRQILNRYVPEHLVDRPKMGFGIPLDSWLRGPLREWAETLLDKNILNTQGFFNADAVHKKWNEHQSGDRNWQYQIWNILMFQAWHQQWMES